MCGLRAKKRANPIVFHRLVLLTTNNIIRKTYCTTGVIYVSDADVVSKGASSTGIFEKKVLLQYLVAHEKKLQDIL